MEGVSPRGGEGASSSPSSAARIKNAFLEFVGPGMVEVRHEELREEEAVGKGQILVEAVCSSISSGTELKVSPREGWRGGAEFAPPLLMLFWVDDAGDVESYWKQLMSAC